MAKRDIVKLNDEHRQPIRLYEYLGFWYWEFVNWPDEGRVLFPVPRGARLFTRFGCVSGRVLLA